MAPRVGITFRALRLLSVPLMLGLACDGTLAATRDKIRGRDPRPPEASANPSANASSNTQVASAHTEVPSANPEVATGTVSTGNTGAGAPAAANAAAFTLEYEPGGRVRVRHNNADLVQFQYLFFGIPWTWMNHQESDVPAPAGAAPGTQVFRSRVPKLDTNIEGTVTQSAPNELTFDMVAYTTKAHPGIVGGGFEFKLTPSLSPSAHKSKPELLPGNRGFRWEVEKGRAVEVNYDPPLDNVYFEKGNVHQLRAFFLPQQLEAGEIRFKMKVRVPEGGMVQKSVAERYGGEPDPSWHTGTLSWDRWPVDLRFLNEGKAAGAHGALKVKGSALVFEDGTPARFWGTNLQASALFQTSKEEACNQAQRIAALGYNLVRFHHHDSGWVKPNIFDLSGGTTQKLEKRSLDALDHWIRCLADEGVYVFLDIHVGRTFEPGDDVPGGSEMNRDLHGKGFSFVNPRIEELMQQFAHSYLQHVNPERGRSYADDPAIAAVAITNENDLTHHFVHRMGPGRGSPEHMEMLQTALNKLTKARKMSKIDVRDVWKPGEPTIALAGLEGAFFQRAIADLHKIGVKKPISTTSHWGASTFAQLPAVALGGLVDVHAYGEAEYLGQDPRSATTLISWIAGAQVAGKPLAISEWALEFNRRDRFVIPLHMAAVAALQGWDMPMHFTYQQVPFGPPRRVQPGSNSYDPGIMAMMPAAAILYRRGDVKPANKKYVLQLSRKDVYEDRRSVQTSATIRTLAEQSHIAIALPDVPELDWDTGISAQSEPGATVLNQPDRDFVPKGATRVSSDTGELMHDWGLGMHTVDTARTQGAGGFIGGRQITLGAVTFSITTPKASIAVSSLDNEPIASSKRMLLSCVAQVSSGADGSLPYRAQPVEGKIELRTSQTGLKLVPLMPDGRKLEPIAPAYKGGALSFSIPSKIATHYFLLEAPRAAAGAGEAAAKP